MFGLNGIKNNEPVETAHDSLTVTLEHLEDEILDDI